MPWLLIVVIALLALLVILSLRPTSPTKYLPWVKFNVGGSDPPDTNALRALEQDARELARDHPPKDLAP